jgi:hypothetical protein
VPLASAALAATASWLLAPLSVCAVVATVAPPANSLKLRQAIPATQTVSSRMEKNPPKIRTLMLTNFPPQAFSTSRVDLVILNFPERSRSSEFS